MATAEYKIPAIDEDLLRKLADRIRPVIKSKEKLRWIEMPDLRKVAFTWSPKLKGKAKGLVELARIRTLHTYGYYGFFKPSIAEVIAQIPAAHLDATIAFETLGPDDVAELNQEKAALHAGFHVALTILYTKA